MEDDDELPARHVAVTLHKAAKLCPVCTSGVPDHHVHDVISPLGCPSRALYLSALGKQCGLSHLGKAAAA